ncbi:hypothetical protein QL093DRAFT_2343248 [Fusarium oxysporum]|nr:hypothetical protein QL093DRAFT_2343248 [Fusarium oxysporum]
MPVCVFALCAFKPGRTCVLCYTRLAATKDNVIHTRHVRSWCNSASLCWIWGCKVKKVLRVYVPRCRDSPTSCPTESLTPTLLPNLM